MPCKILPLKERLPFTCPYTQEEWRIIMIQNVINQIKNYKSIYHARKN